MLSISNIAWKKELDDKMYSVLVECGYDALEIAPTRIFEEAPYERLSELKEWKSALEYEYGLKISSMQSIWYGRKESMFGTQEERRSLVNYTFRAIDFAAEAECNNLVFGCPRNRNIPKGVRNEEAWNIAVDFFGQIGDYAKRNGTVIGLEANPTIYNTNFINDNETAFKMIKEVASEGFKLNLDIGTMICNEEDLSELDNSAKLINHVHISEPGLKIVRDRDIHKIVIEKLLRDNYSNYFSIEMACQDSADDIKRTMNYVKEMFL